MSKTVAIIPARGGSKGIPKKNIMPFCGKPLLAWTIEQALESNVLDEVYVSSDSDEILEVAINYGALPITRPDELATDDATSESALRDAFERIEKCTKEKVDTIVFLQATSPVRDPSDIANALQVFRNGHYDSLFSMSVLGDACIWSCEDGELDSLNFEWTNRTRRQNRREQYLENGSLFIFKPYLFYGQRCNRLGGRIGMYEMPFWKSFELDSPEDIEIVEYFFKEKILKGKG